LRFEEVLQILDKFLQEVKSLNVPHKTYKGINLDLKGNSKVKIGFELNEYKDLVLNSETGLELGGIDKKSFSLVYPIKLLENEDFSYEIHLVGQEIDELKTSSIDFCLFILLGVKNLPDDLYEDLRNLSFISDSIEGFTIRSIPRRFWCRINHIILKKGFSFQLLGKAICHLYKRKFGLELYSIKILMIGSNPILIDKWFDSTEKMRNDLNERWRAKVNTWKKRIDCDFDWACKICPYFISCQSLQEVLERRKDLES
jgi:CO dehydrogenase/acetyl-CoA synthase beta subunit